MWSLIPSDKLLEFLNTPFSLPNYNAYTNQRFLDKKRTNLLFFQSVKKFFCVALPFSLLFFFLLNRVFWFCSPKIGAFFFVFSLGMQLGFILFIQNFSLLNYFFLQNIANLFSLNFISKSLNHFVLFLYGCFFIYGVLFLPIAFYLYKKKVVHFMGNSRLTQDAIWLQSLRYVIRPVMEGFIHILFLRNQLLQLQLLALSSFCFLLTNLIIESLKNRFNSKLTFTIDCFF